MNPQTGWCEGCWRTLDEIAAWSSMDDAARRQVWVTLEERRSRAEPVAASTAAQPGSR